MTLGKTVTHELVVDCASRPEQSASDWIQSIPLGTRSIRL